MKPMTLPLSVVALGIISPVALAEGSDPMSQLRACAQLEAAARLQCLEKLSKDIAPPPPPAAPPARSPPADNWLITETTSPVDYTPIVVAIRRALAEHDSSIAQLSIHCRSGRTDLVLAGPAVVPVDVAAISLRADAGEPVTLAAAAPASGPGVAIRGDVVAVLRSLPEGGELTVRVATRRGATHEGRFSMQGLTIVREKVSAACQWPAAAPPRN
jgi:hypothetical protein